MNSCRTYYKESAELEKIWNELIAKANDWQGYVCLSGSPDIEEIAGQLPQFSEYNKNANFIFEANLYSKEKDFSVSIRQLDDKWLVVEIDKPLEKNNADKESFIEHKMISRIDGKKMKFIESWQAEKDELCEGLDVLKPSWIAFVGFTNTQTEVPNA